MMDEYDDYSGMEPPPAKTRSRGVYVAIGAGFLVVLFLQCLSPSAELVRMASQSVEMARDAQGQVVAVSVWSGLFRLLAIVVGVSVPLLVCWKLWQGAGSSEIETEEVLQVLEEHRITFEDLPRLQKPEEPELPQDVPLSDSGQKPHQP